MYSFSPQTAESLVLNTEVQKGHVTLNKFYLRESYFFFVQYVGRLFYMGLCRLSEFSWKLSKYYTSVKDSNKFKRSSTFKEVN